MYIPKINSISDQSEIIAFMKQFSFATIITAKDNIPKATHLPFNIRSEGDDVILISHFAKANDHWKDIEDFTSLIIFTEPHAYISTKNYDKELNVPTWNYISIHGYGLGKLITNTKDTFEILKATINTYEPSYQTQWENFPEAYKLKMVNGIVAFEIHLTKIEAKKKLSQNRSETEKKMIIDNLSKSRNTNESLIADYMKKE